MKKRAYPTRRAIRAFVIGALCGVAVLWIIELIGLWFGERAALVAIIVVSVAAIAYLLVQWRDVQRIVAENERANRDFEQLAIRIHREHRESHPTPIDGCPLCREPMLPWLRP